MSKEPVRTEKSDAPVQGAASVDQVRPLDDLVKSAEAIDQGAPAAAPGVPAVVAGPGAVDPAINEVAQLLRLARNGADPLVTMLGYLDEGQVQAIWNDFALREIADPLVQILRSWGWSGDTKKLGPWVGLALAFGPPAGLTWAMVKVKREGIQLPAGIVTDTQGQGSGQQQSA